MATAQIRYHGPESLIGALSQMLNEEGVDVERPDGPGQERRDITGIAEAVIASLIAKGTWEAIEYAINRFRKRFPQAEVEVEGGTTEEG